MHAGGTAGKSPLVVFSCPCVCYAESLALLVQS